METERTGQPRGERGTVMVIAALAMTALLLFAALSIDVGAIWLSRTQSQNAADAAALAAAATMIRQIDDNAAEVRLDDARAEGILLAGANATVGEAVTQDMAGTRFGGVTVGNADFTFGTWNLDTRTLDTTGVDLDDPNQVTGVAVRVNMDGVSNARSPTFLSRLIGQFGFDVRNEATAYLGFEGSFSQGEFELPVAIDSCDISTGGCGADFCATIDPPPNSCPLMWPQGEDPVTCLEFSSTPAQNACWTVYDGDSPSVNNPDLQNVVDDGSPDDIEAGDEVFLDNGDKTATQSYIRDLFYGCNNSGKNCCTAVDGAGNCTARTGTPGGPGQPPAGRNRYTPDPVSPNPVTGELAPTIDSWVVKLPVFECQADRNCAGGDAMRINGGVCFEIREIIEPAGDYHDPDPLHENHVIKGRFLCPDSTDPLERELFNEFCRDDSGGQAPGGCNFGLRADHVVIVK
jgi:Flp pilus assembly protein TadG